MDKGNMLEMRMGMGFTGKNGRKKANVLLAVG
jgi:hypothetical protein